MTLSSINPYQPSVSIIVTTFNDQALIKECLFSVVNAKYPAHLKEIIVVDNGSTDKTTELIEEFPVLILIEKRKGVCFARNKGIESSKGEIIVFTDPDCLVSKNWLGLLIQSFADKSVGIVAGGIIPYPGNTLPEIYASRKRSHSQERPLSHPDRPYAMTPNVAIRKTMLNKIGLFDTRFPGGGWEDADLCWRFTSNSKLKLEYNSKAIVFHRYRDNYKDYFIQHFKYGYGLALINLKYSDYYHWDRNKEIKSYIELGNAFYNMFISFFKMIIDSYDNKDFLFSYLEFLRHLGQRVGYFAGSLYKHKF